MPPVAMQTTTVEEAKLGWKMVIPVILFATILILYPLTRGLLSSFQADRSLTGGRVKWVGLRNYSEVLQDPATRAAFLHSVQYTLTAVILEVALGLVIAVTLHRAFRGRGVILAILILPWALPSVVSGVLWRRIFDPDNGLLNDFLLRVHLINLPQVWLANEFWGRTFITVVHVWGVLPLICLIFLAGLQGIPEEVYNASAVDGAGPLRQFRFITFPLLKPAVSVALTVGTILSISIFDEIYVLNGTALNTRSIVMQVYTVTFKEADFAHGTALALIVAVITAAFATLYILSLRRAAA